jgi:hypothetical protein
MEIAAGAARKPNSVPPAGYPDRGQRSFIWDADCPAPLATYPGAWAGRPQTLPYLVLHRVGFTELPRSPGNWCALTAPFHPYPADARDGRRGRSALCCTFLHVAATPRYGAPCPVVFGLSSSSYEMKPAIAWSTPTAIRYPCSFQYMIRWQWGQNRSSSNRCSSLNNCAGMFMWHPIVVQNTNNFRIRLGADLRLLLVQRFNSLPLTLLLDGKRLLLFPVGLKEIRQLRLFGLDRCLCRFNRLQITPACGLLCPNFFCEFHRFP